MEGIKMRINKRLLLYVVWMTMLFILPLSIIPTGDAQEGIESGLSPEAFDAALGFIYVDPSSYKFNGLGFGSDLMIHNMSLFHDLPLAITGGIPYDIDIINKGSIQQTVNGKLNTVFAYEVWFYYTITLYTVGSSDVIQAPSAPKSDWLYHSGWGLLPWGCGQWTLATMTFKNYDLQQFSDDPYTKLQRWRWLGTLSFDISIIPELDFPKTITVENGEWNYGDIHYGFLPSIFLENRRGIAQDKTVYVEGGAIGTSEHRVSNSPTLNEGSLLNNRYFSEDVDAEYYGYTNDNWNSPADLISPPNHTICVSVSRVTKQELQDLATFDTSPTSLSIFDQQREITVHVPSIGLRPEVWIFEGVHNYKKVDFNGGPLGQGVFTHKETSFDSRRCVIGWDVWNVYQTLYMKSGVRILSLYEWKPAFNTTLGIPQGPPNWETGDRYLNAGFEGAIGAKTETWFDKLGSWLWVIIGIIGIIVVLKIIRKLRGSSKSKAKIDQTINLWSNQSNKGGIEKDAK